MMPQALIDELASLKYDLSLDGDSIRYAYHGNGEPPMERARPLFLRLREKKPDVVAFLKRREGLYREPLICAACGSRTFWVSIHGATVCPVCHPPAHRSLVRHWKGEVSH